MLFRSACDDNDLAGAFREGRDTYFFLYDDWLGGLGVARRAFEHIDDLLQRALDLTSKSCCQQAQGCFECIAVSRCFSPTLPSGERRPTDKLATRAFLQSIPGLTVRTAEELAPDTEDLPPTRPDSAPLPDVPALPPSWPKIGRAHV